jgi:hypothetical protein
MPQALFFNVLFARAVHASLSSPAGPGCRRPGGGPMAPPARPVAAARPGGPTSASPGRRRRPSGLRSTLHPAMHPVGDGRPAGVGLLLPTRGGGVTGPAVMPCLHGASTARLLSHARSIARTRPPQSARTPPRTPPVRRAFNDAPPLGKIRVSKKLSPTFA